MIYKGFLLATAGSMAMVPGAQAADMQLKAPVMAAPVASWTGWYLGVHAGAAWQNMNANNTYGDSAVSHIDGSSFIGGGQIGFNWQHGNSVFGLEGDISGLSTGPSYSPSIRGSSKTISTKTNWLSTIRGRMGLAVGDTMVYATGGLAIGNVSNTHNIDGSPFATKSETKTKVGWVVGGGIEHMWDQHWTIGLEGLFVDLGSSSVALSPVRAVTNKSTTFRNQLVIGRAKLNYKF